MIHLREQAIDILHKLAVSAISASRRPQEPSYHGFTPRIMNFGKNRKTSFQEKNPYHSFCVCFCVV
uniref:Uncharacterized protein n=1 Tax=Anguilla anguilla TaxID=7936 RepID=A0A0E9QT32_ANGAN